ncbi:MAG: hypothetical protein ACE5ES_04555 [Candidatus Nanoarchaeia archaeon]
MKTKRGNSFNDMMNDLTSLTSFQPSLGVGVLNQGNERNVSVMAGFQYWDQISFQTAFISISSQEDSCFLNLLNKPFKKVSKPEHSNNKIT